MLCPPSKTPTNLSGGAQLSTLTPFPVSVMTSPVKSFSLKKLFSHQEEIKSSDKYESCFCFSRVGGFPLCQAPYLGWKHSLREW